MPEAWEAMLLGLAALFQGLASEPSLEELGSAGQEHHLTEAQLRVLLDKSASADARSAVLSIAAAQSGSQASADVQSRQASVGMSSQLLAFYVTPRHCTCLGKRPRDTLRSPQSYAQCHIHKLLTPAFTEVMTQ